MKVIHVLRKPCSEGTVAANVLRWGTGALNIDGSRIGTSDNLNGGATSRTSADQKGNEGWTRPWMEDPIAQEAHAERVRANVVKAEALGRWPANVLLQHLPGCSGSCEPGCPVATLDAQSGTSRSTGGRIGNASGAYSHQGSTGWSGAHQAGDPGYGDVGGASRFFKQFKP